MRTRSLFVILATVSLAACKSSTGSEFQRPAQISACETSYVTICGTWTRSGEDYVGTWADGATANLDVVRFTETAVELTRVDNGKNQEFTAVYTGTVSGRTASGTVTWNHSGNVRTGTWTAEW